MLYIKHFNKEGFIIALFLLLSLLFAIGIKLSFLFVWVFFTVQVYHLAICIYTSFKYMLQGNCPIYNYLLKQRLEYSIHVPNLQIIIQISVLLCHFSSSDTPYPLLHLISHLFPNDCMLVVSITINILFPISSARRVSEKKKERR